MIRDKVSASFVRLKKNTWIRSTDANKIRPVGAELFHVDSVLRNT